MFDLLHLLQTVSYAGIFGIVFAETGLLLGFFLPGDSLLITAGLVAAKGDLSLAGVVLAAVVGAVAGDSAGYLIGRRLGPAVFNKPDGRFFRPAFVTQARGYFERYGAFAVVVARFVPVVRTLVPTLAGVSGMPYRTFLTYNLVGALAWGAGVPVLAFYLGRLIPNLDRFILVVVGAVVLLSLVPVLLELRRGRLARSSRGS